MKRSVRIVILVACAVAIIAFTGCSIATDLKVFPAYGGIIDTFKAIGNFFATIFKVIVIIAIIVAVIFIVRLLVKVLKPVVQAISNKVKTAQANARAKSEAKIAAKDSEKLRRLRSNTSNLLNSDGRLNDSGNVSSSLRDMDQF
jgi:uncharacterized membrane protein